MASGAGLTQPARAAGDDHPLRRVRGRRGLTLTALAGLAGLSPSFISMVETGRRPLRRRDHINALAAVLRVPPAEIAPGISPGFDEWAPAPSAPAPSFPPRGDDIAVARHQELAAQFMSQVSRGDRHAAGAWLRRLARDPGVHPWLLLDQLTLLSGKNSRPPGGSGTRLVTAGGGPGDCAVRLLLPPRVHKHDQAGTLAEVKGLGESGDPPCACGRFF